MRGKTVVITGGTSGIGEVAAIALARMGARIVLVARDNSRAAATLSRLRGSAPGIAHAVYSADLLRLVEMKRVAAQIADQEPRVAAAKARDYLPWFVFGLFSDNHAAKVRLKSICFQYGCVSHHQKGPL